MADKLKKFEGQDVLGTRVAITNAGDGLSKALEVDPRELRMRETVYVVLECAVGPISFEPAKDSKTGVVRKHKLIAGTATIVDAELVQDVIEKQRLRIEEASGIIHLDFAGNQMSDEEWEASNGAG